MKRYIKTLCLGVVLMCSASALAQNKTVTGTVVDELGEPVIGATVTVEGTKIATVTDLDGNYKIAAPAGAKVTISYIGYMPQTVKPGGTVKLEEDKQTLEEVVVVGYGTQKKAHLTGSVSTVDMDDVQDLANGNLASSLSGLVNGMSVSGGDARPGEPARISIRDVNSLGILVLQPSSLCLLLMVTSIPTMSKLAILIRILVLRLSITLTPQR